jgi:hypothetical protein
MKLLKSKKAIGIDDFIPLMFAIFIGLFFVIFVVGVGTVENRGVESTVEEMITATQRTDNFLIFLDTPIKEFEPILLKLKQERNMQTLPYEPIYNELKEDGTITDLLYLVLEERFDKNIKDGDHKNFLALLVRENNCQMATEGKYGSKIYFKDDISVSIPLPYKEDLLIARGTCKWN